MSLQTVTYRNDDLILELKNFTEFSKTKIENLKETVYCNSILFETINSVDAEIHEKWNSLLLESNALSSDTITFEVLSEKLHCTINSMYSIESESLLIESIKNAIKVYNEDQSESLKNKFPEYSINSLKQFTRYIPDFNSLYYNIYIDKESGFFGLILKSSKKAKPMLNLLLQENGEITFSFIDRKRGIIKVSGRAYFNNYLEDSYQIKHLIRMIKP